MEKDQNQKKDFVSVLKLVESLASVAVIAITAVQNFKDK